MLEAVIFDFDGILVDTPTYYFKHMRSYLKNLNTSISDQDISNLVGMTFAKKLDYINTKYGLRVQREPFVKATSDAMMPEMEKALILDEHLGKLLKALEAQKITMSVASNNSRRNIDFFLKRLGIAKHFASITAYEDVSRHKPDPQTYQVAVEALCAEPWNCIAVEDTAIGVESAKGAGLRCIAIPNKFTADHDFSMADLVAMDFRGLSVKKLRGLVK